jgi:hypothetical protein
MFLRDGLGADLRRRTGWSCEDEGKHDQSAEE